MKGQNFDLNSVIQIINQIAAVFPRLMGLVYFICLVVLVLRVISMRKSQQAISIMDLAAICIAFGVAVR